MSAFFKLIVNLSLKWLKSATKNFEEMLATIGVTTDNPIELARKDFLHVKNHSSSIFLSGYEILLMLKSIFGCEKRCLAFYQVIIFTCKMDVNKYL